MLWVRNFSVLLFAVLLAPLPVFTQTVSTPWQWTPPGARNNKTLFAPKPPSGNNIFKGEAEVWLAEAIADMSDESFARFDDAQVSGYVSQLGKYLVAHSVAPMKKYEFIVTKDSTANAMTAGGGIIYLNRGMLAHVESEDELAGVLAHEIAHDAFGHAPKTISRQMFWLTGVKKIASREDVVKSLDKLLDEYRKKPLAVIAENLLGFSRFDELEADRAAFYNIYKAGYNPRALVSVFQRFARSEKQDLGKNYHWQQFMTLLLGSHPPTGQRKLALEWEANFVKMPEKNVRFVSQAFVEAQKLVK
jgi:predicted Zn-dependent protease